MLNIRIRSGISKNACFQNIYYLNYYKVMYKLKLVQYVNMA